MSVETLEAGREADVLVAERVMGWRVRVPFEGGNVVWVSPGSDEAWRDGASRVLERECPRFSTAIAAAWQVVEKMRADGWTIQLSEWWEPEDGLFWYVGYEYRHADALCHVTTRAETAPLAICRVALAALAAARTPGAPDE